MDRIVAALSLSCMLAICGCQVTPQVLSPTQDGVVIGDTARLILRSFCGTDFQVRLDDAEVEPDWRADVYDGRWLSDIPLPFRGEHTLSLVKRCGLGNWEETIAFRNDLEDSVEVIDLAAPYAMSLDAPEDLNWNWVAAIFLYPLARVAAISEQGETYLDYVRRHHQHYMQDVPNIDLADACPPALSAFHLARAYGEDFAMPNVDRVIDYIKTTDRNAIGSIDHLGTSLESLFFDSSIWVDSLMMWVLIAAQVGLDRDDAELLDFALPQPFIFADRLLDPVTGLMFHAWNVELDTLLPPYGIPWLRGNGWVLTAVLEMISEMGPDHPAYDDYTAFFTGLAEATLPFRQPSGYWDTVIFHPGYGYEESSGSALIAFAYAKGARMGLLAPEYRDYARDTFSAITARMKKQPNGYSMEEISMGTNPMGKTGYALIPKTNWKLYGYGALLLLAEELAGEAF